MKEELIQFIGKVVNTDSKYYWLEETENDKTNVWRMPLYLTENLFINRSQMDENGLVRIGASIRCVRKKTGKVVYVYPDFNFHPRLKSYSETKSKEAEDTSTMQNNVMELMQKEIETEQLAYRECFTQIDDCANLIVAMGNQKGGKILVGIKENDSEDGYCSASRIVDIELSVKADGSQEKLENLVRQAIQEQCGDTSFVNKIAFKWRKYQGATICELSVPYSENTLYVDGIKIYVRQNTEILLLKNQEINTYMKNKYSES